MVSHLDTEQVSQTNALVLLDASALEASLGTNWEHFLWSLEQYLGWYFVTIYFTPNLLAFEDICTAVPSFAYVSRSWYC